MSITYILQFWFNNTMEKGIRGIYFVSPDPEAYLVKTTFMENCIEGDEGNTGQYFTGHDR